ncbi:sigma-70 family RNA polymerase sigma factor [Winogradskyella sp.]|uniref:sigma-70 family RNA polymerase sigma factor n=1 Tax=Winogradskyella sp. TaxID=1883156 RepID=UPI003AB801B1
MNFNITWNSHKNYLQNFIKTKINDESIVDDILQEVSIKLFDNINQKKDIKNYKSWLFQVTRNTIADYYRKHKKAELLEEESEFTLQPTSTCVCDLSGFVIQTYLPEKYGKPLYLSDIEQKPQQEIADMLQLSLTATKSRILRGRKKLNEVVTDCIDLSYNTKGQIIDFQVKTNCDLPQELKNEMERLNIMV